MSVRQCLLAILDQGPCYGYQLRSEFNRRTASAWPLNVGQVYNTLDRLERDGLVRRAGADDQGHVFYAITDAGSREAEQWLRSPVSRAQAGRDDLGAKLALTLTLAGFDAMELVIEQTVSSSEALHGARVARQQLTAPRDALDLAAAVIAEARVQQLEAEVRLLDATRALLDGVSTGARHGVALDARPPKRGRPVRRGPAVGGAHRDRGSVAVSESGNVVRRDDEAVSSQNRRDVGETT